MNPLSKKQKTYNLMEISILSVYGVITVLIIFLSVETFQLFKTEKSVAILFPVKRRIT